MAAIDGNIPQIVYIDVYEPDQNGLLKSIHGIILPIIWVFVVDISVLMLIYFHRRWSYLIHLLTGLIIFGFTVGLALPLLFGMGFSGDKAILTFHIRFGFAILIVIGIQVLTGIITRTMQYSLQARSIIVVALKGNHTITGYVLLLLCKAQILVMYRRHILYLVVISVWEFLFFSLVIYKKRISRKLQATVVNETSVESYVEMKEQSGIPKVSTAGELADITQGYQSTAIFANCCYNLANIERLHPAGFQIIASVEGRQLERYLFGMYHSEKLPQVPRHSHSWNSLSILGNPIAKIDIRSPYTGFSSGLVDVEISIQQISSTRGHIYEINLEIPFSADTYNIFSYEGYSCVQQLGRYYCLNINNSVTRMYTSVNFLHPKNKGIMRNLYPSLFEEPDGEAMNGKMSEEQIQTTRRTKIPSSNHNVLPLLVKLYPNGQLTPQLLNTKKRPSIKLSELRGLGLKLESIEPGRIILIAGGTGLYPFSDLIDLAFKACLIQQNHRLSSVLLENDPILRKLPFKKYVFSLLGAFNSLEDIHPITLTQLSFLCKNNRGFRATIRFKEEPRTAPDCIQMTGERVEDSLRTEMSTKFSMVWVCGPPRMSQAVLAFMKQCKIEESSFMIL